MAKDCQTRIKNTTIYEKNLEEIRENSKDKKSKVNATEDNVYTDYGNATRYHYE